MRPARSNKQIDQQNDSQQARGDVDLNRNRYGDFGVFHVGNSTSRSPQRRGRDCISRPHPSGQDSKTFDAEPRSSGIVFRILFFVFSSFSNSIKGILARFHFLSQFKALENPRLKDALTLAAEAFVFCALLALIFTGFLMFA